MSNNSPIWYAVYIDDPDKKNGPRALFFDKFDAMRWAHDAALFHADVEPVEIPEFKLRKVEQPNEW